MKAVLKGGLYTIQKTSFLKVKSTQSIMRFFCKFLNYFNEKGRHHRKIFNRLQVLIDFELSACLNIIMPNTSRKKNLDQNIYPYLNAQANWRSNRGDVHFLMKRLKQNERKENKEKLIFVVTVISVLVISGIIISF